MRTGPPSYTGGGRGAGRKPARGRISSRGSRRFIGRLQRGCVNERAAGPDGVGGVQGKLAPFIEGYPTQS